jgi:hypothetical protein
VILRRCQLKSRDDRIEMPKGAVALLCAAILALPAGLAIAHNPKFDSGGGWIHHHTTSYATCNYINQNADLELQGTNARQHWMSLSQTSNGSTYGLSDVSLPSQSDCHPGGGNQTHIQLQDAYYGNTGWRASSTDEQGANAYYHAVHTHINFNLSASWTGYTGYDRRALACKEIGQVIGVERVFSGEWAGHGANNDCMSFGGSPSGQVSKAENASNYTYTDKSGAHSRDLLNQRYRDHAVDLSVEGPLADADSQLLEDVQYDLWIDASSPAGMQRLAVLVDGQEAVVVAEPCPLDDEDCAEDYVFEFLTADYSPGSHTIKVVATDAMGGSASETFTVQVGSGPVDDEQPFDATPAPVDGSGPGCTPFGLRPLEEGTVAVAHGSWSGGTETTQYLDSGGYEVARCDNQGRFVVRQMVELIEVEGESIRIVEAETEPVGTPDESGFRFQGWAALYPDPEGSSAGFWDDASQGALPPTPTGLSIAPDPVLYGHLPDRGCAVNPFKLAFRWDFNPKYKVHKASLPDGGKTLRRIKDGHRVWNQTSNNCGRPDRTDFHMIYDGRTDDRVNVGDGRDTVDFGALGNGLCRPTSVACAKPGGTMGSDPDLNLAIVDEVDIRFNASPVFSSGAPADWYSGLRHGVPAQHYDVFSVAAHEAGHKVGLAHVRDGAHQTLTGRMGADSRRRTLGRGDVRGLYKLYRGENLGPDPR